MVWTPLTIKIANFVTDEHAGQKDKLGAPYILHLFRVAHPAETEDETCVALLHDWAEDVVPGWSRSTYEAIFPSLESQTEPSMPSCCFVTREPSRIRNTSSGWFRTISLGRSNIGISATTATQTDLRWLSPYRQGNACAVNITGQNTS